jgi:tol-pal system protein YbgF
MRKHWIAYLGVAALAGGAAGALLAPAPAGAVNRDMIALQESVNQVVMGQQTLQTAMTQNAAVEKTLIEQSMDSVNKLNGNMGELEKTVRDMQANSGARLDSMSTQIQSVADNLQEMQARMGKLNQQLTDTQTAISGIDSKLAGNAPPPSPQPGAEFTPPGAGAPGGLAPAGSSPSADAPGVPSSTPYASSAPPSAAGAPSSDLLYSNGLRDLTSRKYDLAMMEFRDYLKYYSATDLASNAQFYIGEIYFAQMQFDQAVDAYSRVLMNFPKSFKLAPAHLKKGLALLAIGQKAPGLTELRNVVRLFPGTEEDRRARAKLKELGLAA